MILLNKPITEIDLADVLAFLEEKFTEGTQLDYKLDLPGRDLSKYFAAFSNTRGGVILFGVEEDKNTGLPIAWEGVEDPSKVIEKINQSACNVDPRPHYDTPRQFELPSGRFIVLLRIHEGEAPPYFVQNSGRIWLRNGDVSDLVKEASAETIKALFQKRNAAVGMREAEKILADEVFESALEMLEFRRVSELFPETSQDPSNLNFHRIRVNDAPHRSLLTLQMQPSNPVSALVTVEDLLRDEKADVFRGASQYSSFPHYSGEFQTTHGGVLRYDLDLTTGLVVEQVRTNGYLEKRVNLIRSLRLDRGSFTRILPDHLIFSNIFTFVLGARNYYNLYSYSGVVSFDLALDTPAPIELKLRKFKRTLEQRVIPKKLVWAFTLDLETLNEPEKLKELFYKIANHIYVSLGLGVLPPETFDEILQHQALT